MRCYSNLYGVKIMKKLKYHFNEIIFKIYKKYTPFNLYSESKEGLEEMIDWLKTCCSGSYHIFYENNHSEYYRLIAFAQKSDKAMFKLAWDQASYVILK